MFIWVIQFETTIGWMSVQTIIKLRKGLTSELHISEGGGGKKALQSHILGQIYKESWYSNYFSAWENFSCLNHFYCEFGDALSVTKFLQKSSSFVNYNCHINQTRYKSKNYLQQIWLKLKWELSFYWNSMCKLLYCYPLKSFIKDTI